MADGINYMNTLVDISKIPLANVPSVTTISVTVMAAQVVAANPRRVLLWMSGDGTNPITISTSPALTAGKGFLLTPQNPVLNMTNQEHGPLPTLAWYCIGAAPGSMSYLVIEINAYPGDVTIPDITDKDYRSSLNEIIAKRRRSGPVSKLYTDRWRQRQALALDDLADRSDSGMG